MTTPINLGTFNFTGSGYVPQPTEGVYDFSPIEHVGELNHIWTTTSYIFAALTTGLDVYDLSTSEKIAYITYENGFNTVGVSNNTVYLGTTTSGILTLNTTTISGTAENNQNLLTCLSDWASYPNLTSNTVRYLHASTDGLLAVTESGVDYFKTTGNPTYRSYTVVSGGYKCFLVGGTGYYITVSGTTSSGTTATYSLNRVDTLLTDWTNTSYTYTNVSGILVGCSTINDIYVTQGTATDGVSNTLFCATGSGIYIIEESTYLHNTYYTNNAFTSIWADSNASKTTGRIYIATANTLTVIDLARNVVVDYYTTTNAGSSGDTLSDDDVVDINKVNRGS